MTFWNKKRIVLFMQIIAYLTAYTVVGLLAFVGLVNIMYP